MDMQACPLGSLLAGIKICRLGEGRFIRMEIHKPAVAGTLESSDCQVMVEPGDGSIDFSLESTVIHQYGNQIRKVVFGVLNRLGVRDVKISIVDRGALDCTIKARVECAVFRSAGQLEYLPWGGSIQ